MNAAVAVDEVTKFMDIVVEDLKEVESRILFLKIHVARRTISEASILCELDEMLKIIRR